MSLRQNRPPTPITVPLEKIAHLIRSFSRQQKALLLQLVPELQTIHPEEAELPIEQLELLAYFEKKLNALPNKHPMQDNDIFLGKLTVLEFFSLPEAEQNRLWAEAHTAIAKQLENLEWPVQLNALPAR